MTLKLGLLMIIIVNVYKCDGSNVILHVTQRKHCTCWKSACDTHAMLTQHSQYKTVPVMMSMDAMQHVQMQQRMQLQHAHLHHAQMQHPAGDVVVHLSMSERNKALRVVVGATFAVAQYMALQNEGSGTPVVVIAGARALQAYVAPSLRAAALPTEDIDVHVHVLKEEDFDKLCAAIVAHCRKAMHIAGVSDSAVITYKRVRYLKCGDKFVAVPHFCVDVGHPNAARAVDVLCMTPDIHTALYKGREHVSVGMGVESTAADSTIEGTTEHSLKTGSDVCAKLVLGVVAPGYGDNADEDTSWSVYVQPISELRIGMWKTVNDVSCYRRQKDEARRRMLCWLCKTGHMSRFPIAVPRPYVACPGQIGLMLDQQALPVLPLPPSQREDYRFWARPSEISGTLVHDQHVVYIFHSAMDRFANLCLDKMHKTLDACDKQTQRAVNLAGVAAKRLGALTREYKQLKSKSESQTRVILQLANTARECRRKTTEAEKTLSIVDEHHCRLQSKFAKAQDENELMKVEIERLRMQLEEKTRECERLKKAAPTPDSGKGCDTDLSKKQRPANALPACSECAERAMCLMDMRKLAKRCIRAQSDVMDTTKAAIEDGAIKITRCTESYTRIRNVIGGLAKAVADSRIVVAGAIERKVKEANAPSVEMVAEYRKLATDMGTAGCAMIAEAAAKAVNMCTAGGCDNISSVPLPKFLMYTANAYMNMAHYHKTVDDWKKWMISTKSSSTGRVQNMWVWFKICGDGMYMAESTTLSLDADLSPSLLFRHAVETFCAFLLMPFINRLCGGVRNLLEIGEVAEKMMSTCEKMAAGTFRETLILPRDLETSVVGKMTNGPLSVATWDDWGPDTMLKHMLDLGCDHDTTTQTHDLSEDAITMTSAALKSPVTRDAFAYEMFKNMMLPLRLTKYERKLASDPKRARQEYMVKYQKSITPAFCTGDSYSACLERMMLHKSLDRHSISKHTDYVIVAGDQEEDDAFLEAAFAASKSSEVLSLSGSTAASIVTSESDASSTE